MWNTFDKYEKPVEKELAAANLNEFTPELIDANTHWIEKLESKLNWQSGLMPVVKFIDSIDYAPNNVLKVVNKYDVGVIIKGIAGTEEDVLTVGSETLSCSTKSGCPILLIPEKFTYKAFEKMVYATDLRFCRHEVVVFLTQFARHLNASVLIANISAKGLPYMEDTYARTVFENEVMKPGNYETIYFSNIKERDIPKALDVLVNGMNNDLLVLVNNKYHFHELLGNDAPYVIPENIQVPLLIFPS